MGASGTMIQDEMHASGRPYGISAYATPADTHTGRRVVAIVFDGADVVAECCFLANAAVDDGGSRLYPGDHVYEVHPFVEPGHRRMGIHSAVVDWFERRFECVVRPSSGLDVNGAAAFWRSRGVE